jgi:hypothetical protein
MWDSHFRVGGAFGSDLDLASCPKPGYSEKCIAASLLLHLTTDSSGYFENIGLWTADHDNDAQIKDHKTSDAQINIYSGRGVLIESQGPAWFIGTAVEHSTLYQYQLFGAHNVCIDLSLLTIVSPTKSIY